MRRLIGNPDLTNAGLCVRTLIRQFMKFSVVGTTAFIIDYVLLIIFTEMSGFDYLLSGTVSFIVSTFYNYLLSMNFVFDRREGISRTRELIVFIVLSVIGLGLNDFLLWIGPTLVALDYRITKIFSGVIVSVWNFVSRRIFLDDNGIVARIKLK